MIDFLPPGCSERKAVTSNTSAEVMSPPLLDDLQDNSWPDRQRSPSSRCPPTRTCLHAQSQNITEPTSGSLKHTSPSLLCLATSSADTDMAKCSEGAARKGRGRESSLFPKWLAVTKGGILKHLKPAKHQNLLRLATRRNHIHWPQLRFQHSKALCLHVVLALGGFQATGLQAEYQKHGLDLC